MMLGLRTTVYKVTDIEEAKKWYLKAFQLEPYFDQPYYVGFDVGGFELGLLPEETKKGENVVSYWGVDDIQETYENLLSIGGKSHEAPHNVGGELMVASVFDPWDNIIGIIYNPYFQLK